MVLDLCKATISGQSFSLDELIIIEEAVKSSLATLLVPSCQVYQEGPIIGRRIYVFQCKITDDCEAYPLLDYVKFDGM